MPVLPNLLAVLFIALKLTGHIAWSWWWVLSPLWILWILMSLPFLCGILASYLEAKAGGSVTPLRSKKFRG